MKTIKDILAEAGVDADTQAKVFAALKGAGSNGKDLEIVIANNGEYVKADKYEATTKQLSELQKLQEGGEERKKEFDTLKTELEKLKLDKVNGEKQMLIDFGLEKKLLGDKIPPIAGGYKAYISQMDTTGVSIENGTVKGLDEVYESFKTANTPIYDLTKTTTIPPASLPPAQKKEDAQKPYAQLTVDERTKLKMDNPTLHAKLEAEHMKTRIVY